MDISFLHLSMLVLIERNMVNYSNKSMLKNINPKLTSELESMGLIEINCFIPNAYHLTNIGKKLTRKIRSSSRD